MLIEVVRGLLVDDVFFLVLENFKRVVPRLLVDILLFVLENFIPVVPELFVTIDKVVSMYFVVDFSVVSKLVVVLKPFRVRSLTYRIYFLGLKIIFSYRVFTSFISETDVFFDFVMIVMTSVVLGNDTPTIAAIPLVSKTNPKTFKSR